MSSVRHINFDYIAGYPVEPDVLETMMPFFSEKYGNPSSLYAIGNIARNALSDSHIKIGELINAESPEREIFFTSGATESNNLALKGFALRNKQKGNHIIISSIEHISTINIAKYLERNGFKISYIPVDKFAQILNCSIPEAENLIYELAAEGIEEFMEKGVFRFENSTEDVISEIFKILEREE